MKNIGILLIESYISQFFDVRPRFYDFLQQLDFTEIMKKVNQLRVIELQSKEKYYYYIFLENQLKIVLNLEVILLKK